MADGSDKLPAKRGRGRPTLYKPEMCAEIEEMGRQGFGKAEMAARLNVVRDTLYEWASLHPEFSDALTRATEFSLAWWEEQGRKGLSISSFNAALYSKAMSGRFPAEPYRAQVEVSANVRVQERRVVDPRSLPPGAREALREILSVAAQQLGDDGDDVIEGEFTEREAD